MLRDVEFFQSRLGKIDGFEDSGDYLKKVIKNKEISAPEPVPEPAPPTPTPTPPPAQPSPSSSDEGEEGKKSAEESAELQAQVASPVEKNGDAGDGSNA